MPKRNGACCSSESFWQQDIAENTMLPKIYTKGGQWKCCLLLGIVVVGLGAIMLAETSKVQEHILEYGSKDQFKEFTLSEDWKNDVFFYYELDNFFGNYRNYVENRENQLVGSALMQYKCKGEGASAETFKDAKNIRVSQGNFDADIGKYLTEDVINKPKADEGQEIYPCGLVALSMFLDEYSLYYKVDNVQTPVPLDFEDIAWKTDIDHFNAKMEEKGNDTMIDEQKSWLKNDELLKQRFAIWYRTSASAKVRHLWAKIPGGLTAGKYNVTFDVNGPVWEDWNVKKSVVFSTVSSTGGKNLFMGMICIIWGALLVVSGLVWLVVPSPVKVVPEDGDA